MTHRCHCLSICGLIAVVIALCVVAGCANQQTAEGEKKGVVQETLTVPVDWFRNAATPLESGKKRDEAIAAAAEKFSMLDMDRVNLTLAELRQTIAELSSKVAAIDVHALNMSLSEPAMLRPSVEQTLQEATAAIHDLREQTSGAIQDLRQKIRQIPVDDAGIVVDRLGQSIAVIRETQAGLVLPIRLASVLLGVLILCAIVWLYRYARTIRSHE